MLKLQIYTHRTTFFFVFSHLALNHCIHTYVHTRYRRGKKQIILDLDLQTQSSFIVTLNYMYDTKKESELCDAKNGFCYINGNLLFLFTLSLSLSILLLLCVIQLCWLFHATSLRSCVTMEMLHWIVMRRSVYNMRGNLFE